MSSTLSSTRPCRCKQNKNWSYTAFSVAYYYKCVSASLSSTFSILNTGEKPKGMLWTGSNVTPVSPKSVKRKRKTESETEVPAKLHKHTTRLHEIKRLPRNHNEVTQDYYEISQDYYKSTTVIHKIATELPQDYGRLPLNYHEIAQDYHEIAQFYHDVTTRLHKVTMKLLLHGTEAILPSAGLGPPWRHQTRGHHWRHRPWGGGSLQPLWLPHSRRHLYYRCLPLPASGGKKQN